MTVFGILQEKFKSVAALVQMSSVFAVLNKVVINEFGKDIDIFIIISGVVGSSGIIVVGLKLSVRPRGVFGVYLVGIRKFARRTAGSYR